MDHYIAIRTQEHDGPLQNSKDAKQVKLYHDERLETVVDRMFERCFRDKQYTQVGFLSNNADFQALGVAIEARRSDTVTEILRKSKDPSLLGYLLEVAMDYVRHIKWRNEVCHS